VRVRYTLSNTGARTLAIDLQALVESDAAPPLRSLGPGETVQFTAPAIDEVLLRNKLVWAQDMPEPREPWGGKPFPAGTIELRIEEIASDDDRAGTPQPGT